MMVDGVHMDNITCPNCKFRHPQSLTCEQARSIAANQYRPPMAQHLIQMRNAQVSLMKMVENTVMDALHRGCRVSMMQDEIIIEEPGAWL
jgi:hypothetical protein